MSPRTSIVDAIRRPSTLPAEPVVDSKYGWDWTATTHDLREGIVEDLAETLGSTLVLPGKGAQGWSRSVQCFDKRGDRLAQVYFGGGREDVQVLSTSDAAHAARSALVGLPGVRTSRVDTRFDTLTPYEDLQVVVMEAASTYNAQVTKIESLNGPRAGRTIYLGAPSSAIRVRVYEKWLESPGQYVDGTNRVEVQLRPASKVKERVSSWTPQQTFCASKTTRDLATLLGADASSPGTLHVKRPTPTLEQSLAAMSSQYGPSIGRWLEHSGGDFSKVVDYLLEHHDEQGRSQGPRRRQTAPDRLRDEFGGMGARPDTDLSVKASEGWFTGEDSDRDGWAPLQL